jgi:CysZ protein
MAAIALAARSHPLLNAFVKGFEQLRDPLTRRYVWISVGIAIVVFAVVWAGVGYLLTETALFSIGWLDTVIDVLGGLATLVITWALFPAVMSAAMGLFLDPVAATVERRHYPAWPPARQQPIREIIASIAKLLVLMLILNLVLLLFLIVPVAYPIAFYLVNGYLLGREYYETVALRHVDAREAKAIWRGNRLRFVAAGALIAFLLTLPVVNVVMPVVATAAMVHLWGQVRSTGLTALRPTG